MVDSHFPWGGVFWRSETLQTTGLIDQFGSDDNLMVRAAARYPFVVSEMETSVLFNTDQSLTHMSNSSDDVDDEHQAHADHLDYVIGKAFQLQADILASRQINRATRLATARRASQELVSDLEWWFLYNSLPRNRSSEMATILSVLQFVRAPRLRRMFLRAIYRTSKSTPQLGRLVSIVTSGAVATREALWRRRTGRAPLDNVVRRFVRDAQRFSQDL
jgi:hypothetical protein